MAAQIIGCGYHKQRAANFDHIHIVDKNLLDIKDVLKVTTIDQSIKRAIQFTENLYVQKSCTMSTFS